MREDALRGVAAFVNENDDFTLITHTSPDGDTLGSALALFGTLKRMGKSAQIVCEQAVPPVYRFLPWAEQVLLPDAARQTACAIAVDCADYERMGEAAALFAGAQRTCNIDHHVTNTAYAQTNWVDAGAAAVGEMVAELIRRLLPNPDAAIATCLYTALMTDTGNFAYSNAQPETFRTAAWLLECGADNSLINRRVYRTIPFGKQKLLGRALMNMELLCEGALGITHVTQRDFAETGAGEADSEGIIDSVRDIKGVEAAILLREMQANVYKVSLRSQEYADVGSVAQRMGGGGHKHAAGYTQEGAFEAVHAQAVALCEAALREAWKEL